jgi:hypothetical protein
MEWRNDSSILAEFLELDKVVPNINVPYPEKRRREGRAT